MVSPPTVSESMEVYESSSKELNIPASDTKSQIDTHEKPPAESNSAEVNSETSSENLTKTTPDSAEEIGAETSAETSAEISAAATTATLPDTDQSDQEQKPVQPIQLAHSNPQPHQHIQQQSPSESLQDQQQPSRPVEPAQLVQPVQPLQPVQPVETSAKQNEQSSEVSELSSTNTPLPVATPVSATNTTVSHTNGETYNNTAESRATSTGSSIINSPSSVDQSGLDNTTPTPTPPASAPPEAAPAAAQAKNTSTEPVKKEEKIGSTVSGDGHICANCKVDKTPLWRRGMNGQVLCNACGLYLKARNVQRPISLQRMPKIRRVYVSKTSGSCPGDGRCNGTGGSDSCLHCPSYLNNSRRNANLQKQDLEPENEVKMISCQNCGTVNTPLWRRDGQGHIICNACGLYNKMHKFTRPVTSQDFIKRRKRPSKPEDENKPSDLAFDSNRNGSHSAKQPKTSPELGSRPPVPGQSPGYVQILPTPQTNGLVNNAVDKQQFANYPPRYGMPMYDGHVNMGYPFGYMPVPPHMAMQNIGNTNYMMPPTPTGQTVAPPVTPVVPAASSNQSNQPSQPAQLSIPSQGSGQGSGPVASQVASPNQIPNQGSNQIPNQGSSQVASQVAPPQVPNQVSSQIQTQIPPPQIPLIVPPILPDPAKPNESKRFDKHKSWDDNGDSPLSVLQYLKGASQDTIKEYLLAAQRQLNDKVLQLRGNLEKAEYQLTECENYLKSVNNNSNQK